MLGSDGRPQAYAFVENFWASVKFNEKGFPFQPNNFYAFEKEAEQKDGRNTYPVGRWIRDKVVASRIQSMSLKPASDFDQVYQEMT